MATHSSILAWRTAWTEKPGGLQSPESHSVGCNQVINALLSTLAESVGLIHGWGAKIPHAVEPKNPKYKKTEAML